MFLFKRTPSCSDFYVVSLHLSYASIALTSAFPFKESKSHMLSILNLKSSVTHRVVFYATLIAPIGGAICYFCFFGKFCFLPKSAACCSFLRFLLLPFTPGKNRALLAFCVFCGFCFCLLRRQKKTELVQFQMKSCFHNHH